MMSSRSSHRHHLCPHWTETRWVCLLICTQLIIIEFLLSPHSSRNHFSFYAAARCVFIVIILTQSKNGKWRAKKKSFSSVSIGWQNSIKFLCRTGWKKNSRAHGKRCACEKTQIRIKYSHRIVITDISILLNGQINFEKANLMETHNISQTPSCQSAIYIDGYFRQR